MKRLEKPKSNIIVKMLCKRLAKIYIKRINHCINADYPTLHFLRRYIKGLCEPYGIMIDSEVDCNNVPDLVLNGECYGIASYGGYSVSRLYARHKSDMFIMVSEGAIVTIRAYDEAIVDVRTIGVNASVEVYLYGKSKVKSSGKGIKVRHIKQKPQPQQ